MDTKEIPMIRLAKDSDIPDILRIREQIHKVHVAGRPDIFKMPDNKDDFHQPLLNAFLSDNFHIFVCEADDGIAGYALVRLASPHSGSLQTRHFYYIEEFGVDEKCRHHGYGSELMHGMINHAKVHKAASISLDVWGFNESAEHFYRSFGMTTMKTDLELQL